MKLWSRILMGSLVAGLALSLFTTSADAATKKKKKDTKKKTESYAKKEAPKPVKHHKEVIEGANLAGKPGYFFSDTAATLNKGQVMGAANLTFDTWGSVLQIPVGVSYGITDKLLVNVNSSFFSAGGASGIYYLNFGGKYGFTTQTRGLNIAAGLDFGIGPLSNSLYGFSGFSFDPYGVVTYNFPDGFQLNGKLGLYVFNYSVTYPSPILGSTSASFSYSQFQLDLGAAYPFDSNLTGIAELATNGVVGNGAVGGTPLLVGLRTGHDVQLQGYTGFDFGGATGFFIGGGVALLSK